MLFKPVSDNFSGLLFTKKDSSKQILTFTKELNHEQANQTAHRSCTCYVIIFIAVVVLFF